MEFAHFKFVIPLLLSLCALLPLPQAAGFDYCDKNAAYDVKVSKVEIFPQPLARGKPATFNISATTAGEISKGKLLVDVSYLWFHVHSESHDLCEESACPLDGDFVISHSQELPSYTPPGSYSLTMKMEDANHKVLTCIVFDFSIGFVSSLAEI